MSRCVAMLAFQCPNGHIIPYIDYMLVRYKHGEEYAK